MCWPIALSIRTFFFFYSPADHRDLHSFPTRRSSDLPRAAVVSRRPMGARAAQRPRRRARVDVAQADGDRKSTRLNSSHEWISYAVFCLKKKILIVLLPMIGLIQSGAESCAGSVTNHP